MSNVDVSIASAAEHSDLNHVYLRWGYHGGIADTDIVYIARVDGKTIGLVRRAHESDVVML